MLLYLGGRKEKMGYYRLDYSIRIISSFFLMFSYDNLIEVL
jgi:hypothetical protein